MSLSATEVVLQSRRALSVHCSPVEWAVQTQMYDGYLGATRTSAIRSPVSGFIRNKRLSVPEPVCFESQYLQV